MPDHSHDRSQLLLFSMVPDHEQDKKPEGVAVRIGLLGEVRSM